VFTFATFFATLAHAQAMVIAGVIRNGAGEPLGAVAVSIDVGATLKATATTDTKGQFSIPVPRPGTYSLVDGASWERHDARHRDSGVRHQTCGDADSGGVVVGEHHTSPHIASRKVRLKMMLMRGS